jgi:hypothetical protein
MVLEGTVPAQFLTFEDSSTAYGFTGLHNTFDDTTRLVFHSSISALFPTGPVTLGQLVFRLDTGAPLGATIPLSLSGVQAGDSSGVALEDSTVDGALQVGIRGDVNLDGVVSILDVILTVRMIVGKDATPDSGSTAFHIADMDASGAIDVADVVRQVNTILRLPTRPIVQTPSQPVTVRLGALERMPDGKTAVAVILDGDGMAMGLQMTLKFDPAAVRMEPPVLSDAADGMMMDYHAKEGMLKVVVYGIQPASGVRIDGQPVVWLPVTVIEKGEAEARLSLIQILLVDHQAQTVAVRMGERSISLRGQGLPKAFALHAARPNPFNPSTTISYDVPQQAHITLIVYNLLGQEVVRLVDSIHQPGRYAVTWNGRNGRGSGVASGVYLYRLTSSTGFVQTRRMLLLK